MKKWVLKTLSGIASIANISVIVCNAKCHVEKLVILCYEASSVFPENSKLDDQSTTVPPKSTSDCPLQQHNKPEEQTFHLHCYET
jgi:hypothetical protein